MPSRLTESQEAALYDAENIWAADDDFFLAFANQRPNSRLLDLGCGTGRFSLAAAAAGHAVVGIDPHAPSLEAARRKPGAEHVTWVHGTSAQIPHGAAFDVVVMTAHVAQAISDDSEWSRTLADVYRALVPGGLMAFDSRDPGARAWEHWTREETRDLHVLPGGAIVETWIECSPEIAGLVVLTEHRILAGDAQEPRISTLAFRSEEKLRNDLGEAGFSVETTLGGWDGEGVGSAQGELIFVAHKPR